MSENKSLEIVNEKSNEINEFDYQIENIKSLIYTIRGKQVMLDSDVAILYHCETKYINRVVKRNIERFPEEEFQVLRCQFVTLKNKVIKKIAIKLQKSS